MGNDKHMPAPVPPGNLEKQIKELADKHGLGEEHVKAIMRGDFTGASVAKAGGASTEAFGDGVLLGRFFDFVKMLLPILLPIIIGKSDANAGNPGTETPA